MSVGDEPKLAFPTAVEELHPQVTQRSAFDLNLLFYVKAPPSAGLILEERMVRNSAFISCFAVSVVSKATV